MWSVNVWKALKRRFSERTAACQQNHGGSLTGVFDLICRSAVMLWHFRHNSGLGQTNHLWYGKLAPFTFYLRLAVLTASMKLVHSFAPDKNNNSKSRTHCKLDACDMFKFYLLASLFSLCLPLFSSRHASFSSVGDLRPFLPPPKRETCGINRFATNYTNFTSTYNVLVVSVSRSVHSGEIEGYCCRVQHFPLHCLCKMNVCVVFLCKGFE